MSKHTPGPWVVDDSYVCQEGDDDVGICEVIPMDRGSTKGWFHGPVTDANARLIAAAPELLEALADAVIDFDNWAAHEDNHPHEHLVAWAEKARAAIAKATGA